MKKITALLALAVSLLTAQPSTALAKSQISYEEILYQATNNCHNRKPNQMTSEHHDMIRLMISIEKSFEVPAQLRGMLVAAACSESGYSPQAKGDYRDRKRRNKIRRVPMAIGILQQWPWYEKFYKIDRLDPSQAADAWMKHIVRQLAPVKKRCRISSTDKRRLWVAAWVHAIRAPKEGGRCRETPLHYKILKRWHRSIVKERKFEETLNHQSEEVEEYVPGC